MSLLETHKHITTRVILVNCDTLLHLSSYVINNSIALLDIYLQRVVHKLFGSAEIHCLLRTTVLKYKIMISYLQLYV